MNGELRHEGQRVKQLLAWQRHALEYVVFEGIPGRRLCDRYCLPRIGSYCYNRSHCVSVPFYR